MDDAVGDAQLSAALGRFARLAALVLDEPADWLGTGTPRPFPGPLGRLSAAASVAGRLAVGRVHPGTPGWERLAVEDRCRWWARRIEAVAAPLAATPRVAGALADRLPLQGALGASAGGLAVCAVAREHGMERPEDWVPLLARVLFDRDLSHPAEVARPEVAPAGVGEADAELPPPPGIARRAASGLWWLARILISLPGLFDGRPRGALIWRMLGKMPIIGLAAGVLDERGAVRRAADETRELLLSRRSDEPAR